MSQDENILFPLLSRKSEFHIPRKIILGLNSLEGICKEARILGCESKILIVTDKSVRSVGAPDKAKQILKNEGYDILIFDGIEPEPEVGTVEKVVSLARSESVGLVIGIGGGSIMDTSKMVAMSLTNPGSIREYLGLNRVKRRGVPTICVPTTSGTGSEVTQYAVATVGEDKISCISPHIIPDVALVDPMLTVSMPSTVTAGSGMDALSHAIESIISTDSTPLTDAISFLTVKLIFKYLRRAYFKSNDIEARYHMAYAANLAGIALCNAKMVVGHTISQTFAPMYKIAHGISNGMTLPYIVKFYAPVVAEKLALVALEAGEYVENLSTIDSAFKAAKTIKDLADDIGIPSSLNSLGVQKETLHSLAERSFSKYPRPNSPIELKKENILKVINWMWEGTI